MDFFIKDNDEVFEIEKSKIYKSMGKGIKTVEFILRRGNRLRFVEAKDKGAFPNPINKIKYDEEINAICEKFAHSLDLFFAIILKRKKDECQEMPELMLNTDIAAIDIILLLVINGYRNKEWLTKISEELTRKLQRQIKTWNLIVGTINDETAMEWGLTKKVAI
jgi:hypothetical protein